MKKIILSLIFVIFLISFTSAIICEDVIEQQYLPCEIQTNKLDCSSSVFISKTSNSSINQTISMNKLDNLCSSQCIYNFSFNFTEIGSYSIDICNGQYSLINVIERATQTNNNNIWGGVPNINFPYGSTPREQLKILIVAIYDWLKEILFKFWWILIILIFFIMLYIKKRKSGSKNENK